MTVGGRMIGRLPMRLEQVPAREATLGQHVPRGDSGDPGDHRRRDGDAQREQERPRDDPPVRDGAGQEVGDPEPEPEARRAPRPRWRRPSACRPSVSRESRASASSAACALQLADRVIAEGGQHGLPLGGEQVVDEGLGRLAVGAGQVGRRRSGPGRRSRRRPTAGSAGSSRAARPASSGCRHRSSRSCAS